MKQKLYLAGLILGFIGAILLIIKAFMETAFPYPLRFVGATCLLAGLAANLMLLRESRKNAKKNTDSDPQ